MALAIVAMLVVKGLATGDWAFPPIVVFGAVATFSAAIGLRLHGGIEGGASAAPRGAGAIATAQPAAVRS